jgi:hypothetical protein
LEMTYSCQRVRRGWGLRGWWVRSAFMAPPSANGYATDQPACRLHVSMAVPAVTAVS